MATVRISIELNEDRYKMRSKIHVPDNNFLHSSFEEQKSLII